MEDKLSHDDSDEDKLKNVKISYRPDWLDSENHIFINKLNNMCKSYEKAFEDIGQLKRVVYKTHKLNISELKDDVRNLRDDYVISKEKLSSIEGSIPIMVREMIKFLID